MNKKLLKDGLEWGFILWLIGYVLGFILFAFVPQAILGWIIMPIGTLIALWVLLKKVKSTSMRDFVTIAFVWTILAVILDYLLLVKLLNPADGYYKLDVYLYYLITLILPLIVGVAKNKGKK